MFKRLFAALFFLVISYSAFAQRGDFGMKSEHQLDSLKRIGICDEDGFCEPSVEGMPRPKGFSIIQENLMNYGFRTDNKENKETFDNEVRNNREYEINLRFPVMLKKNQSLIVGLELKSEEFEFENEKDFERNTFAKELEDRDLRKYGLKLYYARSFKGKHYLYTRTSFSLNGDLSRNDFKNNDHWDYFRFSFTGIYGTKQSASKAFGYGLSYSYNFGQLSLYPVIYYNKQFNPKWGIELQLPVKTELRYFPDKKNHFFFTNRLWGDNYVLKLNSVEKENVFLGIASFRSLFTYEREIYDFLWFTVSAGMNFNITFDVTERDNLRNNDPIIENSIKNSGIIRFGIFIVPPRKFYEKNGF